MGPIKHVLLTGSTGFLGSFVLQHLLNAGYVPILYLRINSDISKIQDLIGQCMIFRNNGSEDDIKNVFKQYPIDCIVHLATEYGREKSLVELLRTNLIFPISLLEEGKKHQLKLFLNTDSFFAKKEYTQTYLRDYTNSKRILEQTLRSCTRDIKIANLRIEHVYGENDSEGKFFSFIVKRLIKNDAYIDLTSGEQRRDFIYADDVARAYISVVNNFGNLVNYQEFEVGTGRSIKVREFVEKVAKAVGSKTELRFGALPAREEDINDSYADNQNLIELGWSPQFEINEALDNIVRKEIEKLKYESRFKFKDV